MRKLLSKPWEPKDDERLKALVEQGVTTARAAVSLKRSKTSVYERARKLGCPFPLQPKKPPGAPDAEWWGHRSASRILEE
jgi:hypothetical protein